MTNLLDLPLLDLSRIAALVSGGEPCRYANLPFQTSSRRTEWNNLLPMRKTCKTLHEACNIAIGGLRLGRFARFPFKTVCCMPCVAELTITRKANGIETTLILLQQLTSLKSLTLSVYFGPINSRDPFASEASIYNRLTSFPSCRTLRELTIYGERTGTIAHILSFPYERLTILELDDSKSAQSIPRHISRTLESFALLKTVPEPLLDTHGVASLHVARAPLLRHLDLTDPRSFHMLTAARPQDQFKRLGTLSLFVGTDEPSHTAQVIQAARSGCFPNLRTLEIDFWSKLRIEEVQPFLQSCCSTLKTLRLDSTIAPSPGDIESINAVISPKDINLELSFGVHEERHYSVSSLAKIQSLTRLLLEYQQFGDIHRLAAFPKLREVRFIECSLSLSEKKKILKTPGNLKRMEFLDCILLSRDDDGKMHEVAKQHSFTWNGLSEI